MGLCKSGGLELALLAASTRLHRSMHVPVCNSFLRSSRSFAQGKILQPYGHPANMTSMYLSQLGGLVLALLAAQGCMHASVLTRIAQVHTASCMSADFPTQWVILQLYNCMDLRKFIELELALLAASTSLHSSMHGPAQSLLSFSEPLHEGRYCSHQGHPAAMIMRTSASLVVWSMHCCLLVQRCTAQCIFQYLNRLLRSFRLCAHCANLSVIRATLNCTHLGFRELALLGLHSPVLDHV